MKKLLSLAALFAALSYTSPAFADWNISGDASFRMQDWITGNQSKDNVDWQYRLNLKAAADLGEGYFVKALVTNEETKNGGWQTVNYGNSEVYNLELSQFYIGHNCDSCHFMIGRLPLNTASNPVFDLTLYPTQPLNTPVALLNLDRAYGANIGGKVGPGELNGTVVVLDNHVAGNTVQSGDGLMNDGYAFKATYKFNIGNVTVDPQVLTVLTESDVWSQQQSPDTFNGAKSSIVQGNSATPIHFGFRPFSYGTNVVIPAGAVKFTASGFLTRGSGTTPNNSVYGPYGGSNIDYFGDLFRIKAESGPFTVWYDHNSTTDKSSGTAQVYTNNFFYTQYKINLYKSSKGNFTLMPTLRYLSAKQTSATVPVGDTTLLLPELWATVSF